MLIKYILSYAIGLLIVYFCNDGIADLLSGKQAIIRFIELTLPLTIPSLVYFFQVSKDRQERIEKENQKEENLKKSGKDKFEKSLPFFFVRDGMIFAKNPQKAPILNVRLQIEIMKNDFSVVGAMDTKGSIYSEHYISIGGLVDGDKINIDNLLENNNIPNDIKWFGVSAMTITNDIVYYIYLPYMKMGWHFYKKNNLAKSTIVKYIGYDTYCELAELLAVRISDSGNELSYKGSILNNAVAYLGKSDLQGAFSQLIVLVREVKELQKCEKLYVLDKSYLMLHQLTDSQEIEPNYFKGNLFGECEFTNKYKEIVENSSHNVSIKEYLYDIIELIKEDEKVSLDFWLRNVEVYIREQSSVFNKSALEGELKRTIPHLVGGTTDKR